MYLNQGTGSIGYAYEEAEFAIDYSVGTGGLAGGIGGPNPYLVYGNFAGSGGYAEFGGQVNYWWIPTSQNSLGVVTYGNPTLLGQLDYDTQLTGPGAFAATSNGTWTGLSGVSSGPGILELTGEFYLAGDPGFSISVEAVPEPLTMVTVGMGVVALGGYIRRRRMAAI